MASLAVSERHNRWAEEIVCINVCEEIFHFNADFFTKLEKHQQSSPVATESLQAASRSLLPYGQKKSGECTLTDYTEYEQINTLISTKASRCFSRKKNVKEYYILAICSTNARLKRLEREGRSERSKIWISSSHNGTYSKCRHGFCEAQTPENFLETNTLSLGRNHMHLQTNNAKTHTLIQQIERWQSSQRLNTSDLNIRQLLTT